MINATLTISVPLDSAGSLAQSGARGGAAAPPLGGAQGGGGADALVDMLAEALMQALFQKKGDGATFNNPGNNPLMEMIAKFMDQNGSNYGGPHDATGSVRNWQDEVSEDNYLDKQELAEFSRGLKDALSSVLGGLGGLAGGLMGGAVGGVGGSMLGSALGQELGNGVGGAMSGLGNQNGGLGVGPGFGGGAMGNMSPMGQSGFVTGGNFASHVGKTAVDSIDFKESGFRFDELHLNGGQRFSIDKEDKDMAKEIAKFMDQNPENYGPAPKNGGWAGRIESGKDFNQDEMNRFKQAMNDVKGVMDGQSTGNQQTDMDAMLLSNSIINQAMHKIAA